MQLRSLLGLTSMMKHWPSITSFWLRLIPRMSTPAGSGKPGFNTTSSLPSAFAFTTASVSRLNRVNAAIPKRVSRLVDTVVLARYRSTRFMMLQIASGSDCWAVSSSRRWLTNGALRSLVRKKQATVSNQHTLVISSRQELTRLPRPGSSCTQDPASCRTGRPPSA